MIDLNGMVSIPFLKKAVFTGLQAAVWPGPFIFSVTEEEKKTFRDFAFNPEGLKDAVAWLNEIFEEKFAG